MRDIIGGACEWYAWTTGTGRTGCERGAAAGLALGGAESTLGRKILLDVLAGP